MCPREWRIAIPASLMRVDKQWTMLGLGSSCVPRHLPGAGHTEETVRDAPIEGGEKKRGTLQANQIQEKLESAKL